MKLKPFFFFTLFLSFLFFGCDKKKTDPTPQPNAAMTAKVEGKDWAAAVPVATLDDENFTLMGASPNGQAIGFYTINTKITQPGTYTARGVYSEVVPGEIDGPTWANPTATISITKLDMTGKKVSGTFTLVGDAQPTSGATGTRTITNGVFTDITLQ